MRTIIVFLIVFTIIVVIHEFGHYYFAKRAGILVREFAIGMGPKLFSKQGKDGTTYTLRMLPLGGYVRLAGLYEEDEIQAGMQAALTLNEEGLVTSINLSKKTDSQELPIQVDSVDLIDDLKVVGMPLGQEALVSYAVAADAFIIEQDGTKLPIAPRAKRYESVSPLAKMMTNVAGPLNNFILSFVAFALSALLIGMPVQESMVGEIVTDSPAAQAGLQSGDHITKVDDTSVSTWNELVGEIQQRPDQTAQLTVERGDEVLSLTVNIEGAEDEQSGETQGKIGIGIAYRRDILGSLAYGVTATWSVITGVLGVLSSMLTSGFNINNFGGPVAMAQATGQVASMGTAVVINFLATLSANLGVFNLLPIPALDGGKIVLNFIELVRGKPLSESKEGIITLIGVALMVVLMIAVTWNDISRAFF